MNAHNDNLIHMPTPTDDLLKRLRIALGAIGREWDAPFRSEVMVAINDAIKAIELARVERHFWDCQRVSTVAVLHQLATGDVEAADAALRGLETLLGLMGAEKCAPPASAGGPS